MIAIIVRMLGTCAARQKAGGVRNDSARKSDSIPCKNVHVGELPRFQYLFWSLSAAMTETGRGRRGLKMYPFTKREEPTYGTDFLRGRGHQHAVGADVSCFWAETCEG